MSDDYSASLCAEQIQRDVAAVGVGSGSAISIVLVVRTAVITVIAPAVVALAPGMRDGGGVERCRQQQCECRWRDNREFSAGSQKFSPIGGGRDVVLWMGHGTVLSTGLEGTGRIRRLKSLRQLNVN
jgi:hypothetical protein